MPWVEVLGYIAATTAFFVLAVLLMTAWRGRQEGGLLLLASIITAVWAGYAVYQSLLEEITIFMVVVEILRDLAWLSFLLLVVVKTHHKAVTHSLMRVVGALLFVMSVVLLYLLLVAKNDLAGISFYIQNFIFLVFALIGLVLVEQIFRNIPIETRWAVKYLCLGLGGMFAYDFYLYTDTLLLKNINEQIWGARGYINTIVMPLIAVTAARNPQWSLDIFVSRNFVFYSSALMGAALYLLAMAAGGYYIKHAGGDWGEYAQLVFFFGAILVLLVVLLSGQAQARLKVFLNKHFFNYRYDYREEWLLLIQSLSEARLHSDLNTSVISAIARIVESPGGMLWLQQNSGDYHLEAGWNMPDEVSFQQKNNSELLKFLSDRKWVVDLDGFREKPEIYKDLVLPSWISLLPDAWLIVPLIIGPEISLSTTGGGSPSSSIMGFIVLRRSRANIQINWEVRDLLLTAARQCASFLALLKANEDLVDARQFEAFNRLSAFVVHDIKNIVAQLLLITKNAERHGKNPEFIKDVFSTIDNTVNKMNHMLKQLRQGHIDNKEQNKFELNAILREAVKHYSGMRPIPTFISTANKMTVFANEDRFMAVIGHLIQNAQEATANDGYVHLSVCQEGEYALLLIKDNGCGMSKQFIRNRLYRPFDTTKGNAGMGIGVYESREFIQNLGGQLDVHSEPGRGTTVFIRIKLLEDSSQAGDALP